jgi:hypothetical protein
MYPNLTIKNLENRNVIASATRLIQKINYENNSRRTDILQPSPQPHLLLHVSFFPIIFL